MPTPVAVTVRYTARPDQIERARTELGALIEKVLQEEGCQSIHFHQAFETPAEFLLYERWLDREVYLGEHMRTEHLQAFIGRAPEFLAGPPSITLWSVLES